MNVFVFNFVSSCQVFVNFEYLKCC